MDLKKPPSEALVKLMRGEPIGVEEPDDDAMAGTPADETDPRRFLFELGPHEKIPDDLIRELLEDVGKAPALAAENLLLRQELEAWKAAAGWREDGLGPQSPAEVAVFRREAERVNGQVAALEIAKARRERDRLGEHAAMGDEKYQRLLDKLETGEKEVAYLKEQLERYWRRYDKGRRYATLWKGHAKKLEGAALRWVPMSLRAPEAPGTYVVRDVWIATTVHLLWLPSDGPDKHWLRVSHWMGPLPVVEAIPARTAEGA